MHLPCAQKLLILLCWCSAFLHAQEDALPGLPAITNFSSPKALTTQGVYDITQDDRGIMYFGVDRGVLAYDGVRWQLTPTSSIVRSVSFDGHRIYAGMRLDFGYLEADSLGNFQYRPIIDTLPPKEQSYGGTWFIKSTSREVLFNTLYGLYRYRNDQLDTFRHQKMTLHSTVLNDTFYVRQSSKGLCVLDSDSLQTITGGPLLSPKSIAGLLPTKAGAPASEAHPWIVIYRFDPPELFDGQSLQPFSLERATTLVEDRPYKVVRLPDNTFVVGTYLNGLYRYAPTGKLLQHLTREDGLVGNTVQSLFVDQQGDLWVGCRNGLSHLTFSNQVDYYDFRRGIDGRGNWLARYQKDLYVANNKGVHRLATNGYFQPVEWVQNLAWQLLPTDRGLLAATADGVAWVDGPINPSDDRLITDYYAYRIHQTESDPNRVIFTAYDHLGSIRYVPETGRWVPEGPFLDMDYLGMQMMEYPKNTLWVQADSSLEQYHLNSTPDSIQVTTSRLFGPNDGLPGRVAAVFTFQEQVQVSTTSGFFTYDEKNDSFYPSTTLPALPPGLGDQAIISEWVRSKGAVYAWVKPEGIMLTLDSIPDNTFQWVELPRISTHPANGYRFYPDKEHRGPNDPAIWLSTDDGLLRYSPTDMQSPDMAWQTFIREVRLLPDSTLFAGNGQLPAGPALRPKTAALRFSFAAPGYVHPETIRYQYWLEGFEKTWSAPTDETTKDYTNLRHGKYTFRIRAIDVDGEISESDSFSFSIRTPWYLNWWAYVLYGLAVSALVWVFIKSRVWYLERQKKDLEIIVESRTLELKAQTEKLVESERIKSRFFANISHEFRTPLTVITGMVERIRQKNSNAISGDLDLIERNGHILLRLINQLLDLTKLESNQMQLHLIQDNVIGYIGYIVESFYSLAESKDVRLRFESQVDSLQMDYDPSKLLQILSNLLSNALKFTPAGGEVIVLTSMEEQTAVFGESQQKLNMEVTDNGIGIPEDKLPFIFNHFYQVDNSSTRRGEGTGVGLSLVKELVQLFEGSIRVKSQHGRGTTFTVALPVRRSAPVETAQSYKTNSNLEKIPVSSFTSNAEVANLKESEELLNLPQLLIIEDNQDVVTYLRACLEDQYQIRVAENGQAGIHLAQELIPDIIISDVMMPFKNGFEVTQTLKADERTSHIPIILLTAKNTFDDRMTGLEGGADAYLSKPFNERELLVRLKKLVALRRQLRDRYQKLAAPEEKSPVAPTMEDAFITKVRRHIMDHLDDTDYTIEHLCRDLSMSRMQLHRKLKALTNFSTAIFIRKVRLQEAYQLLQSTDQNVSEISYAVGFGDPSYFTRVFRKEYGVPPSEIGLGHQTE